MHAISVMNFKGGVGKTTLTANLGVELARRGKKVLLIDLDPQCSLTFSFYSPQEYKDRLRGKFTIKCWLDGFQNGQPLAGLDQFFVAPAAINRRISEENGHVHLIPSDLSLLQLDLEIMRRRGANAPDADHELFLRRSALYEQLRQPALTAYDYVLIDCPPSFGILAQSAIVASERILIPTIADYLSTVSIESMVESVPDLKLIYNEQIARFNMVGHVPHVNPAVMGIVYNMVPMHNQHPTGDAQYYMDRVARLNRPVFKAMIRESTRHFGRLNPANGPAILTARANEQVYVELMELATEFLTHFEQPAGGRQHVRVA